MKVKKTVTTIEEVSPSEWLPFNTYEPKEAGEYDVINIAAKRQNKTIRARWDGRNFIGPYGPLDMVLSFIKVRTANEAQSVLLPSFS